MIPRTIVSNNTKLAISFLKKVICGLADLKCFWAQGCFFPSHILWTYSDKDYIDATTIEMVIRFYLIYIYKFKYLYAIFNTFLITFTTAFLWCKNVAELWGLAKARLLKCNSQKACWRTFKMHFLLLHIQIFDGFEVDCN